MKEKYCCIECHSELNEKELKEWWESSRCCSGYMCGCYGLPTDPPICDKCIEKYSKESESDE